MKFIIGFMIAVSSVPAFASSYDCSFATTQTVLGKAKIDSGEEKFHQFKVDQNHMIECGFKDDKPTCYLFESPSQDFPYGRPLAMASAELGTTAFTLQGIYTAALDMVGAVCRLKPNP